MQSWGPFPPSLARHRSTTAAGRQAGGWRTPSASAGSRESRCPTALARRSRRRLKILSPPAGCTGGPSTPRLEGERCAGRILTGTLRGDCPSPLNGQDLQADVDQRRAVSLKPLVAIIAQLQTQQEVSVDVAPGHELEVCTRAVDRGEHELERSGCTPGRVQGGHREEGDVERLVSFYRRSRGEAADEARSQQRVVLLHDQLGAEVGEGGREVDLLGRDVQADIPRGGRPGASVCRGLNELQLEFSGAIAKLGDVDVDVGGQARAVGGEEDARGVSEQRLVHGPKHPDKPAAVGEVGAGPCHGLQTVALGSSGDDVGGEQLRVRLVGVSEERDVPQREGDDVVVEREVEMNVDKLWKLSDIDTEVSRGSNLPSQTVRTAAARSDSSWR
eukprot:762957-Hanusia_phi.AAC.1